MSTSIKESYQYQLQYQFIYMYISISTSISIYININMTSTYLLHFPLTSLRCSEFPARKRMRSCHSTAKKSCQSALSGGGACASAVIMMMRVMRVKMMKMMKKMMITVWLVPLNRLCVHRRSQNGWSVRPPLSQPAAHWSDHTSSRAEVISKVCSAVPQRFMSYILSQILVPASHHLWKKSLVSGGLCSTALPFDTHLYVLECVSISNVLSSSQPSIFPASSFVAVGCSWTLPWPIARVFWRSSVWASDETMLSGTLTLCKPYWVPAYICTFHFLEGTLQWLHTKSRPIHNQAM